MLRNASGSAAKRVPHSAASRIPLAEKADGVDHRLVKDSMSVVADVGKAVRGRDPRVIDDVVALLPKPITADLVAPLLTTLVDGHEHEEVLWSIVHTAETAPTGPYEQGLLRALPQLSRSAPDWAQVLLLRCMNSESSLEELVSALAEAPEVERQVAGSVAEAVRRRDPERFSASANTIASALT